MISSSCDRSTLATWRTRSQKTGSISHPRRRWPGWGVLFSTGKTRWCKVRRNDLQIFVYFSLEFKVYLCGRLVVIRLGSHFEKCKIFRFFVLLVKGCKVCLLTYLKFNSFLYFAGYTSPSQQQHKGVSTQWSLDLCPGRVGPKLFVWWSDQSLVFLAHLISQWYVYIQRKPNENTWYKGVW